jgi:KaiC/GvpD/RAD55 family RecA-like ATPase
MTSSVELQVISKILTTDSSIELDRLCAYDESYYAVFKEHIRFILEHKQQYGDVPDVFTFQAKFEDIVLVQVNEPIQFLEDGLRKNKQQILLLETFNKLSDLGSADVSEAWEYLSNQVDSASELDTSQPLNIVKDADKRAQQILEFNKQKRIPTGFKQIDKCLYGGLSTVEELLVIIARTNSGKSWVCTKMMESAQANGFPVLFYSPEMQSCFIGARFDTWRSHFKNSDLFRGNYTEEYLNYLKDLAQNSTDAFVVEDKDMSEGKTTVSGLERLVKKHHIKLLIVDGLSYIAEEKKAANDSIKYKDICNGLFRLSKTYGCAVVVAMQANRDTKETKDEKGLPFPTMYEAESSDHPARIATQVFTMRQIFEKHIMDIRLEKSRTAANTRPVFSYSWDPNTGNMEYVENVEESANTPVPTSTSVPTVSSTISIGNTSNTIDGFDSLDDDDDDDIEF